jgi:NADH-quinone oxidoreductase subunit G/NADP-reducing hydrogenase subunit HndD
MAVSLTIDNEKVTVREGGSIFRAAQKLGIRIPSLCYDPRLSVSGACRICVVEVEGQKNLVPSCAYPVAEGMVVRTNTYRVRKARKTIVELLLANHPNECLICVRNNNCGLQDLAIEYGIREWRWTGKRRHYEKDVSTTSLERDPDKCILCGKCVKVCQEIQTVHALDFTRRGFSTLVEPPFHNPMADTVCVLCGQCILACPTAAIRDRSHMKEVRSNLDNPDRYCVVQVAPAIRASIGEEFGLAPGTLVTGKLVTALRRIGFKQIFDTDFGADLAVMEEGHELIDRLKNDGPLPMFTSCSPGWIKFMEHFYPQIIPNMSTCKSPQQMTGSLVKSYFAESQGIDPENIYMVSVMPCSAKKFECERPEMEADGLRDVDAVLTTRELARLLKIYGIQLDSLPEGDFDKPLGISSGAGAMFGVTGGMMEAALRTVSEVLTDEPLQKLEFNQLRGFSGIKEGSCIIGDKELKLVAAHGLGNARIVIDKILNNEAEYHFVEIMACPGGCIGGGGQPIPSTPEILKRRIEAIYSQDRKMHIRKSHENPAILELYATYLGEPLGEKSHKLLHTHYHAREPRGI